MHGGRAVPSPSDLDGHRFRKDWGRVAAQCKMPNRSSADNPSIFTTRTFALDGMIARSIQIEDKVQGIYFREWAVKVAQELDVAGWIRNLQDGRVNVYAVGDETAIERFIRRLHDGSPASDVDKVTTQPAEVLKLHTFLRRQSEKGAD